MFRITIEIVPFGIEEKKRTLYKIDGANINTDDSNHADYQITTDIEEKVIHQLNIEKFNRENGILKLAKKIISELIKKGYK
jgi:hypothetical protein